MPTEIERKYLIKSNNWKTGLSEADSSLIQQGYLNEDPGRVVRIRIRDSKAFLTIKGRAIGISRAEFEYQIPVNDASELLGMCLGNVLIKRRYEIKYEGNIWEVDEFLGKNKGLILAEIELESEDQSFETPEWIGKEVTMDMKYTNLALAHNDS
ncbi:MAG: CYTH domain-containing protein [Bacteroidales bacterium]|nr:CYTH domain-containing protein [Bacteroidales bacterium]